MGKRTHVDRFDSLAEFTDWCATAKPVDLGPGQSKWAGTRNHDAALRLARHGWHDIRHLVDATRSVVMEKVSEVVDFMPNPTMDVAGAVVDMGVYMTGHPECMIAFPMEPVDKPEKVLRVLMDPGASAGYGPEWMANRGGAVASLLEILQMLGHSLEIHIVSPVQGVTEGRVHTPLIAAHKAGTVCDIDALMFACGHPSMLRRMIFALRKDRNGGSDWAMGGTVAIPDDVVADVDAQIVVNRDEHRLSGEPDAGYRPTEWVLWHLGRLGLVGE
jgi:hypothetical protein